MWSAGCEIDPNHHADARAEIVPSFNAAQVSLIYELSPCIISYSRTTPVVICGDFNALPESGVFEFLSKAKVRPTHSLPTHN